MRVFRMTSHGRLTKKPTTSPRSVIRTDDKRPHRYHYDSQHGWCTTPDTICRAAGRKPPSLRPAGPQGGKNGCGGLNGPDGLDVAVTETASDLVRWDGNRLTTIQQATTRIH
ncbi:hypothetical protein ACLK1T_03335 [Escherichia coli]